MERIFRVILETSFYATIVGLIILLAKKALKDRLNGRWHFLLWLVLLIKLVMPFGPQSALSLFNVVPEVPTQALTGTIARPIDLIETPATGTTTTIPVPELEQPKATHSGTTYESVAAYIWVGGVVAVGLWLLASFLIFSKKLHSSSSLIDERGLTVFEGAKRKMGVTRRIDILMSDSVETPSLFGLFRPRILMPITACALSNQELEYIQLHELAHYKRKDIVVNYLLLIIQTIHWFNPVIWYLFRCIRQDMELATDEMVLSSLESREHKAYGRALLTVIASFSEPRMSARLLYMADTRQNIERRVNMIRMAALFNRKGKAVLAAGILCITVLGVVLLTNGISRGDAAIQADFIEVYSANGFSAEVFQGDLLWNLSLQSEISIVMAAIKNSVRIEGILDVRLPEYVIKLYAQKENPTTVFLWLPSDSEGLGMLMYPEGTHTGYSLTRKDTSALVNLFASKHLGAQRSAIELLPGKEQLTMSVVKTLAEGGISPSEVVARYEGRSVTSGIFSFYTELNDNFALLMGFLGMEEPLEPIYTTLIDERIGVSLDLTSASPALFELFVQRKGRGIESIDLSLHSYRFNPVFLEDWGDLSDAENIGPILGRHDDVYKLITYHGASVDGFTYFIFRDHEPVVLAHFYAVETWEVDVNGDGTRDIVYTFGSPGSNVRIASTINGQLVEVDLNTLFSSPSVNFHQANKEFVVSYAFDAAEYRYRFEPLTWILKR